MPGVLLMGFWVETNPSNLGTPPKCQNPTFASMTESVHCRLIYDVIIASLHRKLRMLYNVDCFLEV